MQKCLIKAALLVVTIAVLLPVGSIKVTDGSEWRVSLEFSEAYADQDRRVARRTARRTARRYDRRHD